MYFDSLFVACSYLVESRQRYSGVVKRTISEKYEADHQKAVACLNPPPPFMVHIFNSSGYPRWLSAVVCFGAEREHGIGRPRLYVGSIPSYRGDCVCTGKGHLRCEKLGTQEQNWFFGRKKIKH